MKELNYKKSIRAVLHKIYPESQITKAALLLINNMLMQLAVKIIKASNNLSNLVNQKLISITDMTTAVKIVIGGETAKYAIKEGIRAVSTYKDSRDFKRKVAKEKYAGLKFKISTSFSLIQKNINKGFSVYEDAVIFLTAVLEYISLELFYLSENSAKDNRRVQIMPRDIFFAVRNDDELNEIFKGYILGTGVHDKLLTGGASNQKVLRDSILGITKPGLQRLMRRAGVKNISGILYEESRSILQRFVEKIVQYSIVIAKHRKHTTLMYEDGVEALNSLNISVYNAKGYPGTMAPCKGSQNISKLFSDKVIDKKRKQKPKTNLLRIIEKYQKTTCTLLPHASVDRLIREIGQDYDKTVTRYEINYMWLIHAIAEDYMVKLYQNALLVALRCNRLTLMPGDIQLVRKIQNS